LFACGEMPSAEGRFILTILFILSNYLSKIRIHSFSFSIKLAAFQASVSAEHRHPKLFTTYCQKKPGKRLTPVYFPSPGRKAKPQPLEPVQYYLTNIITYPAHEQIFRLQAYVRLVGLVFFKSMWFKEIDEYLAILLCRLPGPVQIPGP